MTIIETLPATFTGGNSGLLPFYEHGVGTTAVTHRWLAARQSGSTVTALKPSTGKLQLAGNAALVTDEYGNKALRFNGVDNILSASLTGIKTVTMVARATAPHGTRQGFVHTGGVYMLRSEAVPPGANAGVTYGGGGTAWVSIDMNGPKYHVISLVIDGATGTYAIDGLSGTRAGVNAGIDQLVLGRSGASQFGQIDVLETFTSDRAHTTAQLAEIRAAMKAHYGTALA